MVSNTWTCKGTNITQTKEAKRKNKKERAEGKKVYLIEAILPFLISRLNLKKLSRLNDSSILFQMTAPLKRILNFPN